MKKVNKLIILSAIFAPVFLTGCVDETLPTEYITQEELSGSDKAAEAVLFGMSAYMNYFGNYSDDYAIDFGYPSVMHIRDVSTGDMPIVDDANYDWYTNWSQNVYLGADYAFPAIPYTYYYMLVLSTNKAVETFEIDNPSESQQGYLGVAYAFRAAVYLDLAQMYEYLPNDVTSSVVNGKNDVQNLTVPIVTNLTTEEEAKKNPRATREDMAEFILSDLDNAEQLITKAARLSKTLPDLSVVYGLKARAYMWLEQYDKAADYARKAQSGYTPLTAEEWHNTSSGFNNLASASWLWGGQYAKEDNAIQSAINNWISWSCNEATFGYAGVGVWVCMDRSMYDRISDTDFRKTTWKAPADSPLSGQEQYISAEQFAKMPDYASLKFRPGEGSTGNYQTGATVAYPLMRVEEMYFIEAEAEAHSNPSEGRRLLESFMQNYRDPAYRCRVSDKDAVIEEIVFQKRIELFGEGLTFYDIKRLNYSVTRGYEGTNWPTAARFNTNGRPAWMNFVLSRGESNANPAVLEWNNPDPSQLYPVWTGE